MKKKGFTLVELLAVIVILAIISLIAIPLIGNIIEKVKLGALESSVTGLVESANMYYANNTIKGNQISETIFDFKDGEQIGNQKLDYKGKVYNGKLILHVNGEVAVCIDDNKYYAYKNKDIDEVISGIGTCLYDGTTGNFNSELNSGIVYALGSGTTFDVSDIPNYKNFTEDNFIISLTGISASASATGNTSGSYNNIGSITKSYNDETGILTVNVTAATAKSSTIANFSYSSNLSSNHGISGYATASVSYTVYLATGEIKTK